MSNQILLKRSVVAAKVPLTSDLAYGELGLNYFDGKLYAKINNGSVSVFELTANQTITVSGDATGSGTDSIALTLANSGVSAGTYTKLTVDAKGRVTVGASLASGDVTTALGFTPQDAAAKGVANGYASLDSGGKVPNAQLPSAIVGALQYQGVWDASTNTPTLANGTGTKGYYYKVSNAGTTNIDGNANWTVGDLIVFDGTTWDAVQGGSSDVTSVAGRIGAITLAAADISGLATSATTDTTNASNISSGTLGAGRMPALTGDATSTVGTTALTLATVNSNVGSGFNTFTVNGKGLITAASTTAYLTGNQAVTLSGDATGSGATAITVVLAASGVTAGTYNNSATAVTPFTVNAKGLVTGTSAAVTITPAWASVTGKPTTVSGYGFTDITGISSTTPAALGTAAVGTGTTVARADHVHAMPNVDVLANVTIASKATNDLLQWNGTAWVNKTISGAGIQPAGSYLTGNQTVTLSGDATGSGATAITVTLANSGVTAGTYDGSATTNTSFTVDVKGRVTAVGSPVTITPAFSSITSTPTTLAGYGITDAMAVGVTIDGGTF